MNLRYDTAMSEFVAEFSSDFAGDLAAVKAAGFRTAGPPEWRWFTSSVKVLNKLRQNRPASGLTITTEALSAYQPLADREAKNDEVRKALAVAKKQAKKEQKPAETAEALPDGRWWTVGIEDLHPSTYQPQNKIVTDLSLPLCHICAQPVYFYELQDPPTCLWDEKIVLDNFLNL
jgi:hypothetical protein